MLGVGEEGILGLPLPKVRLTRGNTLPQGNGKREIQVHIKGTNFTRDVKAFTELRPSTDIFKEGPELG